MKPTVILVAALVLGIACLPAHGDWAVADRGMWPETWPEELEPLRDQSRTLRGSLADLTFYEIPFASREEFEEAWPHLLEIATEGVPITLLRGPHHYLGRLDAGVRIWHPAYETRNIWLVVDGEIVDLNRIRLPANTTIIDQRFDEEAGAPR